MANLTIGVVFLLFGWWLADMELPTTHNHHPIGEKRCIGSGVKCSQLIYCENTGNKVQLTGKHKSITKEDSLRYKIQ